MADFPDLPFEGDQSDFGPEQDVPDGDYLTDEEAADDETVDSQEQE